MTDSTEAKAQEESTARVTWLPAARLLGNALPSLVFLPSFHFIDSIDIDFHQFWAIRLMRSRNGLERLLPNCQIDSLFFLTFRRRRYWVFTEFSGEHLIHWLPPPIQRNRHVRVVTGFLPSFDGCGTGVERAEGVHRQGVHRKAVGSRGSGDKSFDRHRRSLPRWHSNASKGQSATK